jgi:CDP-glucose 4,6-dehydratase
VRGAGGRRGDCVKIPALVKLDVDFWNGRRVLVTGHTGFKGAWLSLWLQSLGARVTGLAPGVPTHPSLHELADVGSHMRELAVDVRDAAGVLEAMRRERPEVVLHLAAQPMVRRSLRDPALTYEVNVMGTVNVLEAVRLAGEQVLAVVVVTSDKCYENPRGGLPRRFVEENPLGGSDPYSSSKACAELVAGAYRRSFFSGAGAPRVATARAGNVIGGGDWGEDRIVPDAVRAADTGEPLLVRNPDAVRPWQHVLSPLGGYLRLAEALSLGDDAARAWNFGPSEGDVKPVGWIVQRLAELWGGELSWRLDERPNPPEAGYLALDSSAAEALLGWRPAGGLEDALELIVAWHRAHRAGEDMRRVSLEQIAAAET